MDKKETEYKLEQGVKAFHQYLYSQLGDTLGMDGATALLCALAMAGMADGPLPETGGMGREAIKARVLSYLQSRQCPEPAATEVARWACGVLGHRALEGGGLAGELFKLARELVVPHLGGVPGLDYTGIILEAMCAWGRVEGDGANDVVLTPRHVRELMAELARTGMDSYVWDRAAGTGGLLLSAMDVMVQDARGKITDRQALERKARHIREKQVSGMETLPGVHALSVINMLLSGGDPGCMARGDGCQGGWDFPATALLLNPPYSAGGKGLCFAEEALRHMEGGYASVLVQENAGAGQGGAYPARILEKNTLLASIRMPARLFGRKANVQTAIYVFRAARPHREDDVVRFLDFSNDGYARQGIRKCSGDVNLKDVDDAAGRYREAADRILGREPSTQYYAGLYAEDTISLSGSDWAYWQHRTAGGIPERADFEKTVRDYWGWKAGLVVQGRTGMQPRQPLPDMAQESVPAWSEFPLTDLFAVCGTRKIRKPGLKPDGAYPYITAQRTANATRGYCDAWTEEGGCLTVDSAVLGTVFYQAGRFSAAPHVEKLVPRFEMTERTALFFQAVLNRAAKNLGYSYQHKRSQAALREETICLPCTENGKADFAYMERYIAGIEEEIFSALASFLGQ